MKKILSISCGILAVIALAVSCNKVSTDTPSGNNTPDSPSAEKITITATLAEALTKVSFDPAFTGNTPSSMAHTWEAGDKLRITNESSVSVLFDLISGENTDTGVFQGDPIEGTTFTVEAVPVNSGGTGLNQTQDSDGATDHLLFVASATGVTDLSNIQLTETSNIIGIVANLPADVAATIEVLEIEKSTNDFETSDKLSILISNPGDTDEDDILKVYANVPADWSIAANTKMFLRFKSTNTAHTVYTRYQEFASAVAPVAGKFNYIKINCSKTDQHAGAASSDGSSTKPYLIADPYQLAAVNELATGGQTTYFKMIADVDMTGMAATYTPLNYGVTGYNKKVNFDGNNKTISNLEKHLFYVFKGSIYNLTLDHFSTTSRGILAEYIQEYGHSISKVHVTNGIVNSSSEKVGGLVGQINSGTAGEVSVTITDCSVSANVSGGNYTGGLIGYIVADCSISGNSVSGSVSASSSIGGFAGYCEQGTFSNNVTSASVTSSGTNVGGFIGGINSTADGLSVSFENCHATGNLTNTSTKAYFGGFAGYFNGTGTMSSCYSTGSIDKVANYGGGFIGRIQGGVMTFTKCHSEGDITTASQYSGGLIGAVSGTVTFSKCYSSSSLSSVSNNGGGFLGCIIGSDSKVSIENCYATGSIGTGGQKHGAFTGAIVEATNGVTISNCYASGDAAGSFKVSGLVASIEIQGVTVKNCAGWGSKVTASSYGDANWSSGAIVGVAWPTCILTNNFRNPGMKISAFWGTESVSTYKLDADYDHPDVSASSPLVVMDKTTGELRTAVATNLSNTDNYPIYPHHGKHVATGTSLSTLASMAIANGGLGWDSSIWDFTGDLPTLK